ncbi:MAG: InlB B-repeat-containing protein [Acholeplasmataceae bacterium]|jgi:hypothetical protein
MKKYIALFFTLMLTILLVSCDKEQPPKPEPTVTFTVTFDSQGGTAVPSQTVESGKTATEPNAPEKDGFTFGHWFLDNEAEAYVFSTPVTADITLKATWNEVVPDKTNEELIQEDIAAIQASLFLSPYQLNLPKRGPVNGSFITWISNNKYITRTGIVIPLLPGDEEFEGSIRARINLNGKTINHDFEVPLSKPDPVVITNKRTIPFTNLTTEYDVADRDVDIFYEEGGSVPYVKVSDFFNLLQGFIDPEYELTFVFEDNVLTVSYDYLDEEEHEDYLNGLSEEDGWYHLELIIDTEANTIATPDPGFYWAYVYSTKTNYSRHINYDRKNEGKIFQEGDTLIYDLNKYNMDIVMYEDEVVIPYFVANQLFAGVSYYNIYYNYDGLFGIYAIPDKDSDEYKQMHNSSTSGQEVPVDLSIHTFNFLGFAFNEFYGIRDLSGVENYFDLFFDNKNNLVGSDSSNFDNTLFTIINKDIDEPHTSYRYPGYYSKSNFYGPSISSLSQFGKRVLSFYEDGLYAVDDAIVKKWELGENLTDWGANLRPKYWFLDKAKTVVVLALDGFSTSDIQESKVYDATLFHEPLEITEGTIVPNLFSGNKFFYYNNSTKEYKLVEMLVKGVTNIGYNTYKTELENLGFVFDEETNVYEKTIGDTKYLLRLDYGTDFNLFSVSVLALGVDQEIENPHEKLAEGINDLVEADSAVYMEMYLELIDAEAPLLETILLDLTFNTGGNVGALYRVVGFITGEPFSVASIDGATHAKSRSYVYIDGVPTKYRDLRWGLLTSPASFSAANSLVNIFKQNKLGIIIGTKTGGGASSITPILLPNGTAFTMSSNSIGAQVKGTGTDEDPYVFESIEFGIDPDAILTVANIYDAQKLLDILADN